MTLLWGLPRTACWKIQILLLWFITVEKLQPWSSNQNSFMAGVTITWEVGLKGHRIRRVENYCSVWGNKVKCNKCDVLHVCAQTSLCGYGMWSFTCLHTDEFLCVWKVRFNMFVHRPPSMCMECEDLYVCAQTPLWVWTVKFSMFAHRPVSMCMECEVLHMCAQISFCVYGIWGSTCVCTDQSLCVWNVRFSMFAYRQPQCACKVSNHPVPSNV